MQRATVYGTDPAASASAFEREGAELIHIVDLDGAIAGEPATSIRFRDPRRGWLSPRRERRPADDRVRYERHSRGGGYRLNRIGGVPEPGAAGDRLREFPERIFGSIDARDGRLAIKGWVETSELTVPEAALRFRNAGVAAVIVTDIARDGTEAGADVAIFAEAARHASIPVIASGGVATLEDLRR